MNTLVLSRRASRSHFSFGRLYANRWRLSVFFLLLAAFAADGEMRELLLNSMSDAFLQVTAFVAGTLALVFWFERKFAFDLGELMRNNLRWQPLIASALGAIPGCGGAIIVVTQFTKGYASFGAFIAVLVSTMGDAAILLVARDPMSALIVISISLVAGTITGIIVDKVHGKDFLAVAQPDANAKIERHGGTFDDRPIFTAVWVPVVAIGVVLGLCIALQYDPDTFIGALGAYQPTIWFGFLAAMLCILMWAFSKRPDSLGLGADTTPDDSLTTRVVKDTNFVTAWVVFAFLIYEIAVVKFGLDIGTWFAGWALLVPLVAILIGFVPGCGPQVVVTSLYLAGAIPLSAQLSNAIANDGDALFPALALAPKAAVLATLYSAIPAVIIGYSWLFLFEM